MSGFYPKKRKRVVSLARIVMMSLAVNVTNVSKGYLTTMNPKERKAVAMIILKILVVIILIEAVAILALGVVRALQERGKK